MILENLLGNILCMPKLKEFSLEIPFKSQNFNSNSNEKISNIKDLLNDFFDNVSNLELNSLTLKNYNKKDILHSYTKIDELKKEFPNLKLKDNCKIYLEI